LSKRLPRCGAQDHGLARRVAATIARASLPGAVLLRASVTAIAMADRHHRRRIRRVPPRGISTPRFGFDAATSSASLPATMPATKAGYWGANEMIGILGIRGALRAAVAVVAIGTASSALAQGAAYPNRTITLVLPFAAGSGTDTTTRIISQHLAQALGVSIVIDNKPGANGSIAATFVARAAPDGYTLFVTTNTSHSANPYLLKTMNYDPIKDFTPIARTGDLPFMLVINPEIPANSVGELITLAKKDPGKYSYASGSSSAIVSGATFANLAKLDLLHVPYKSSPPALTDVIAGRVSMMFVDVPTGLPHVNGKALKALAVTTKYRSKLLPNLPTMDEAGVKGFDITSWQGYLGPANMPWDIVLKLNTEIRKIIDRPEMKKDLADRGMEAFSGPPEEFDAFLKEQLVVWEKLIREAGIEKQ
jgi:tripartite-type tricarboxylate transporter receptor subunit TctC